VVSRRRNGSGLEEKVYLLIAIRKRLFNFKKMLRQKWMW
jgi:hypothetical protein